MLSLSDGRNGPFDAGASPGQRQTGYTVGGVGWYRRTLVTPPLDRQSASLALLLEGCYMNCTVYLNGHPITHHPYGYTLFSVPLARAALAPPGEANTIAVRVGNTGSNSRWYSGSGLYRPVTLLAAPALHLVPSYQGGVYITTPDVKLVGDGGTAVATARVHVAVRNDATRQSAPTRARLVACDERARVVASGWASVAGVAAGQLANLTAVDLPLGTVKTWSPDQPALLSLAACLEADCASSLLSAKPGDTCPAAPPTAGSGSSGSDASTTTLVETFGVRAFTFSSATGLVLNGKSIKLQGGCVHHDVSLACIRIGLPCPPRMRTVLPLQDLQRALPSISSQYPTHLRSSLSFATGAERPTRLESHRTRRRAAC